MFVVGSKQFSDFLRSRARENFGRNSTPVQIFANSGQSSLHACEKGPTRERRASQKPKSLTFQKFRPDFTTDLKEAWILCHSVELQNHAKTDSARPSTARRRTPPVFCVAQLCTPANSASSASFLNLPLNFTTVCTYTVLY